MDFLVAPSVIFMLFVAPIWIVMHYRYRSRMARGISEEERKDLDTLLAEIDRLTDRVQTLESILDDQRGRQGHSSATHSAGAHSQDNRSHSYHDRTRSSS